MFMEVMYICTVTYSYKGRTSMKGTISRDFLFVFVVLKIPLISTFLGAEFKKKYLEIIVF
jgi:hypothetical protein